MPWDVWSGALELVFPVCCVACGRAGSALCRHCVPVRRPQCLTISGRPCWAADRYDGALRTALLAYKERGRRDLGPELGARLAAAVRAVTSARPAPLLVSVPSSRAVSRSRGGDHVRHLARHVPGHRVRPVLRLTRRVADSAGLSTEARRANLTSAFAARPAPEDSRRTVVVVDDITTTGATLAEAFRALDTAGWDVLGAAVVAATPRHLPMPDRTDG